MVHLRLALLREVGTKSWSLWPWFLWDPTSKETMVDQDYVVCEVCVCVYCVYVHSVLHMFGTGVHDVCVQCSSKCMYSVFITCICLLYALVCCVS